MLKTIKNILLKRKYPWFNGVNPDVRQIVLDGERLGFSVVSYDAERDEVRFEHKSTGAWDACVEIYNASTGELVMKART